MVTDSKGTELVEGQTVILADGAEGAEGVVRGVHEGGCTVWMDANEKDKGEVRTVESADVTVKA